MASEARKDEPAVQVAANTNASPWLTAREAADYCRFSYDALIHHVSRGNLVPDSRARPGFRGHRFRRETLDAFLRGER